MRERTGKAKVVRKMKGEGEGKGREAEVKGKDGEQEG